MPPESANAVAIMGATATGKSEVAIALAETLGGEVVSMDSRQVYRGLDIGTAKVTENERRGIAHHLIDILDPDEPNSAGKHLTGARAACEDIGRRGRVPILAGGTGLYFRVLFNGLIDVTVDDDELEAVRESLAGKPTDALLDELRALDPGRAAELNAADRLRIARALEIFQLTGKTHSELIRSQETTWRGSKIVLTMPRERLRERIAARTHQMFEAGWIDEVRGLLSSGCRADSPAMMSLGYREIASALAAGEDPAGRIERIITQTRKYAKRQETFFRSESDAIRIDVTSPGFMDRVLEAARAGLGL